MSDQELKSRILQMWQQGKSLSKIQSILKVTIHSDDWPVETDFIRDILKSGDYTVTKRDGSDFDEMRKAIGMMDKSGKLLTPPIYILEHLIMETKVRGEQIQVTLTPNSPMPLTFVPSIAGDIHFAWAGSQSYRLNDSTFHASDGYTAELYGSVIVAIKYTIQFIGLQRVDISYEHDFDPVAILTAQGMSGAFMELHKSLPNMPKLGGDIQYFQFSENK